RVETERELEQVLAAGRWDCETHGHHDVQVVLADLFDAERLPSTGLLIVSIVPQASEHDQPTRLRYPVVLTPSARPSAHVPAIETAARRVIGKQRPIPGATWTR